MKSKRVVISPHLTVYRWQLQMISSILHRITGVYMFCFSIALTILFTLKAYGYSLAIFRDHYVAKILFELSVFAYLFMICYHLINGIRFLLFDFLGSLSHGGAKRITLVASIMWAVFAIFAALLLMTYSGIIK